MARRFQKQSAPQAGVMQSTHGLQAEVVQQLCLHCATGKPWRTTQAWKHWMSLAHWELLTQFSVGAQHAPMMH